MHVAECFFYEGEHYGPPGCYHETVAEPDEMMPGWTVQNRQVPDFEPNYSHWKEDAASPERYE